MFGALGLLETMVQVAYMVTNHENFSAFEGTFFVLSGLFEAAGEILLLLGIAWIVVYQESESSWRQLSQLVTTDPLHNLFMPSRIAEETNELVHLALSASAVIVSTMPLVAWASFLPVWGFHAQDDDSARLVISVVAFVVVASIAMFFAVNWVEFMPEERGSWSSLTSYVDDASTAVGLAFLGIQAVVVLYAIQKLLGLVVLFSDAGKLCSGFFGKALVLLLLIELVSAIIYVGYCLTMHFYQGNSFGLREELRSLIGSTVDGVRREVESRAAAVKEQVGSMKATAEREVSSALSRAEEGMSSATQAAEEKANDAKAAVESKISSAVSRAEEGVNSATKAIEDKLNAATAAVESKVSSAVSRAEEAVRSSTEAVEDNVDAATATAERKFSSAVSRAEEAVRSATEAVEDKVDAATAAAESEVNSAVSRAEEGVSSAAEAVEDKVKSASGAAVAKAIRSLDITADVEAPALTAPKETVLPSSMESFL